MTKYFTIKQEAIPEVRDLIRSLATKPKLKRKSMIDNGDTIMTEVNWDNRFFVSVGLCKDTIFFNNHIYNTDIKFRSKTLQCYEKQYGMFKKMYDKIRKLYKENNKQFKS
jgi:hypothetical protein